MDLYPLLALVRESPAFQALSSQLRNGGRSRVAVNDASKSYVAAALAEEIDLPIVIVVPSAARSRQLADQLRAWLDNRRSIEVFAERDAIPYERLSMDPLTAQARLRALGAALAPGARPIIIATARSLMDRLALPVQFASRVVELYPGAVTDPSDLAARLLEAGYTPSPLVEDPATFSRRGGIVDVFSPAEILPVRIEFFGDEIESIRQFDPLTQRSRDHLERVELLPAAELFGRDGLPHVESLSALDRSPFSELGAELWRRDLDRLSSGETFDVITLFAGYLGNATLLDYLPAEMLLFVEEPTSIHRTIEVMAEQAEELYSQLAQKGELPSGLRPPYVSWEMIAPYFARRDGVDFAWQGTESANQPADGPNVERTAEPDLERSLKPITPYGGRLKVLMDDVGQQLTERARVVILTQQAARLAELFREREIETYPAEYLDALPPPGSLSLIQGGGHEGFRLTLPGSDLVLLSDLEVFGWTKPRRQMRSRPVARDAFLSDLSEDDLVVHVEHGVGRYRGLKRMGADGTEREYLALEYAAGDKLFVPIEQADRVSRYVGFGDGEPTLHRLGGTEWSRAKSRARAAAQQIAEELLALYAAREVAPGHAFAPDSVWQTEMEAAFPYVETSDQLTAIEDVKADMERARPMDRLLCGDVGYGKTEVALRAAFKAVMDGRQVAVLVPTTVLAQQHFNTFRERLQAFPVRVEMLSRFRSNREQHAVVEGLRAGSVDICIGTHRLVQKDVEFKDLGLVIIDEEQRFGVVHKERLKQLRREVDVLTLTATPIPRTLHMSLAGVRDMSTMETAPEDRLPIRTYVQQWDDGVVREAILREMDRGGQVFFVHNRVQTIYQRAQRLQSLVPEAEFLVGHGQLPEDRLEKVMVDFAAGRADVLVCSTIIESGLDIPNANTIIVNHADRFGLAQLYQLRGRVGRGANRAYAYFLYGRDAALTEVAEKRLKTIFEANELGAGFHIAMKDLEIRGAGNLLGAEQSGHVAAVGFHLYTELLAEAVGRLRGQPIEKPVEVSVDLPVDALLPTDYVVDENARLNLYRRFATVKSLEDVGQLVGELRDRYGPLPEKALDLIWLVQIRQLTARAGAAMVSATDTEVVIRFDQEPPVPLRTLESEFAPFLRAGRMLIYVDRAGLGARWQETLERVLERIGELAAERRGSKSGAAVPAGAVRR